MIKNIVIFCHDTFYSNLEEILAGYLNTRGIIHVVSSDTDIWKVVKSAINQGRASQFAIDLRFVDFSETKIIRACQIDMCKGLIALLLRHFILEVPLNLREYQEELSREALRGNNSVICAPTGSGKTVIAAYIIRNHIYNLQRNGKPSKVIFTSLNLNKI